MDSRTVFCNSSVSGTGASGPAPQNPLEDFDWERYYVKLRLKDRKEEGGEYSDIGIGGEGRQANVANGAGRWPQDQEMPRVDPKPKGGAAAQLSEFTFDLEVLSYCARVYARHMKFHMPL